MSLESRTTVGGLNSEQLLTIVLAPDRSKKFLREAFEGTASPRQAIRAKCLECKDHSRVNVRFCAETACPLHLYRPFQIIQTPAPQPSFESPRPCRM